MNDWRLVHGRLLWHTADLTVTIDALGGPSAAAPAVSPPRPGLGIRYGDAWAQDLGQGVYLLRFENSLGATVLRFRGAPVPPLAVEVLTRKLGDAADPVSHVALYRRLVADVLAAMITLPFAVSGARAIRPSGRARRRVRSSPCTSSFATAGPWRRRCKPSTTPRTGC